jgi:hypothetical protein
MNRDTLKRAQEAHDDKHPPEEEADEIAALRCMIEAARALLAQAEEHLDRGDAERACELMCDCGDELTEAWA